jgi:DNA-binding Lrp family transcriptional regulator
MSSTSGVPCLRLLSTLVDRVCISPVLTISEAAKIMGVSYQAAQNSMQKLVDAGILQLREGVSPATFVAQKILAAVNPPATRNG